MNDERDYRAELRAAEQRVQELEEERELVFATIGNLKGDLRLAEATIVKLKVSREALITDVEYWRNEAHQKVKEMMK